MVAATKINLRKVFASHSRGQACCLNKGWKMIFHGDATN